MKIKIRSLQLENLTKWTFFAPKWWMSLLYILILGAVTEGVCYLATGMLGVGISVAASAFFAFITTKPLCSLLGRQVFTWNRSGLMALAGAVFTICWMIVAFLPHVGLMLAYTFGVGFVFFIRIIVLVAVVDYRTMRMLLPAFMPTIVSMVLAYAIFGPGVTTPLLVSVFFFGIAAIIFLVIFDKPLRRGTGLSAMRFVNVYMGHLTNGTHDMEDYLREISVPCSVPETTFFFRRVGKKDIWFVVPNLHPGPMADIGGSNFPTLLFREFEEEATLLVSHGCASHDLNLISNDETAKIISAIRKSKDGVSYSSLASKPIRSSYGAVSVLSQRFGDSILLVTTRSPEMTEDMDFSIGRIVMGEGKSLYRNVGFVDAHNSVRKAGKITYPSTKEGNEYITAGVDAMNVMSSESMHPFSVGACRVQLPFSKKEGFGETGMVVMVAEVDATKTAYVLFDGNNVYPGVRETLRDAVLALGYAECEILTTDSHVVNEKSGMNPVGMTIPPEKILPFIQDGLKAAEADLAPAEVGASTGLCEDVAVFGPGKITQLVALVSGLSSSLLPYVILIVLVAFFMVLTMCLLVL